MADDANLLELVLRLVLSMGLIVAIIVVAAKVMKGRTTLSFGRGQSDGPKLDVLDRTQVARHATVAVVRVGGRGLVVGVTEHSVTLLAEAPELVDRYEQAEASGRRGAFSLRPAATPAGIETLDLAELEAGGPGAELVLADELGDKTELVLADELGRSEAFGLGDKTERERTALVQEQDAPGRTRMNFFEALRESTVRRS
jgi:flagellar biogenesis protein FliO